jgi:hypothetical protein
LSLLGQFLDVTFGVSLNLARLIFVLSCIL